MTIITLVMIDKLITRVNEDNTDMDNVLRRYAAHDTEHHSPTDTSLKVTLLPFCWSINSMHNTNN